MLKQAYTCGVCQLKPCATGSGNYPKFCPTVEEKAITEKAFDLYNNDELTSKIMQTAARTPKADDGSLRSRVEETIEFIEQMGYKKVGVGFCYGLSSEAKSFVKKLEARNLEAVPVCCKVGGNDVSTAGIENNIGKYQAVCNPVTQAEIMNKQNTEINVSIGLCVGHDILFNKHSNALQTSLVVKDRKYQHCSVSGLK